MHAGHDHEGEDERGLKPEQPLRKDVHGGHAFLAGLDTCEHYSRTCREGKDKPLYDRPSLPLGKI
jgi:hypothetical protein